MKKLVYIFMIAAVLVSCKKNTTETPAPAPEQQMQEVTFDINTILESPDRAYSVPNCIDSIDGEINKYAEIIIEDAGGVLHTYFAEIYFVNGLPYTKAIMLPINDLTDSCDSYVLKEFYVWDNMGTDLNYDGVPGDLGDPAVTARSDDQLFKAAPLTGSVFWDFAMNHVEYQFEVCAFFKTKIKIDVICFVPDMYDLFGFFWFEITEITVREICFFGDFCLKDTYIYEGTAYDTSGGGVFIDEAAIFEIRARHRVGNGDLLPMVGTDFNNRDWYGVGEPLCIRYPDYDAEVDYYEFDLYLWAMTGTGMDWVFLYTFTWNDIFEDTYDPGADGVFEFVVGNCVASPTDMLFPPYMNLPTRITMHLTSLNYQPDGYYWDWKMTYAEPVDADVYDIPYNTVVGGWCGDAFNDIASGQHTNTLVFSTLDDAALFPAGNPLTNERLNKLNYLLDHFHTEGINALLPMSPGDGLTVQQSIWGVIHSGDGLAPYMSTGMTLAAENLATDALQYGANYSPLPGGNAGVLFFSPHPARVTDIAQLILIVVDP